MQSLTQPELLLKPFADEGDKNTIPETNTDASNPQLADLTNGFPAITSEDPDDGGLPAERKDFNGLGYLTTTYDYFYQAGGTFTFNDTISTAIGGYPIGARLWYTDNNGATTILRSTIANNTNNFNNGSMTGWTPDIPALGWDNVWTGNNVFSGDNKFTSATAWVGSSTFAVFKSDRNSAQAPSSYSEEPIVQKNDVNDILNTSLRTGYLTDGSIETRFYTGRNGTNKFIAVGVDNNGNGYTKGITPGSATDSSTSFATTDWVQNWANNNSTGSLASWSKSANGYYKLKNGLILQWGTKTAGSSGSITFPTAFSSVNYTVSITPLYNATGVTFSTNNHTTTKCDYLCSRSDVSSHWMAIGY